VRFVCTDAILQKKTKESGLEWVAYPNTEVMFTGDGGVSGLPPAIVCWHRGAVEQVEMTAGCTEVPCHYVHCSREQPFDSSAIC
jgi:hypothetical protein